MTGVQTCALPIYSVGYTGPILSGQNMILQFLMCSMLLNILTVLANFPGLIFQFSQKTSVTTVATLVTVSTMHRAIVF